jgi:hypothetical protein
LVRHGNSAVTREFNEIVRVSFRRGTVKISLPVLY